MDESIVVKIDYTIEIKTEPMNDPNDPNWKNLEDEEKEAFLVLVYERGHCVASWMGDNAWFDYDSTAKTVAMNNEPDLLWFNLTDKQREPVSDACADVAAKVFEERE